MSCTTSLYQSLKLTPTYFLTEQNHESGSFETLSKSTGIELHFISNAEDIDKAIQSSSDGVLVWEAACIKTSPEEFYLKIKKAYPSFWQIILSSETEEEWIQAALESRGLYACYSVTLPKQHILQAINYAIQAKSLEEDCLSKQEQLKVLQESYDSAINIFSSIIDIKTFQPQGHARKVSDHSQAVALGMGCDAQTVRDISYAGLLHDLGRLILPGELINKPFENLTPDEKKILKKYPSISEFALMALNPLEGAARIIRSHQEYIDGSGFPDGLKGDEIPVGSQILAVVADYYQLQEGKIFDENMSREDAIDFLIANIDKRYSKNVVNIFRQILDCEHQSELNIQRRIKMSPDLETGMVLDKDLMSVGGMLLLPKGHVLNEENIKSVCRYEKDNDMEFRVYIKPL